MARKNTTVTNISNLDAVGIYSGFCGVGILPTARRGIAKPTTGGKGKPTAKRSRAK